MRKRVFAWRLVFPAKNAKRKQATEAVIPPELITLMTNLAHLYVYRIPKSSATISSPQEKRNENGREYVFVVLVLFLSFVRDSQYGILLRARG